MTAAMELKPDQSSLGHTDPDPVELEGLSAVDRKASQVNQELQKKLSSPVILEQPGLAQKHQIKEEVSASAMDAMAAVYSEREDEKISSNNAWQNFLTFLCILFSVILAIVLLVLLA